MTTRLLVALGLAGMLLAGGPNPGDWICTAEPVDQSNKCTVFAFDKARGEAERKALETCQGSDGCGADSCSIIKCHVAQKD